MTRAVFEIDQPEPGVYRLTLVIDDTRMRMRKLCESPEKARDLAVEAKTAILDSSIVDFCSNE